MTITCRCGMKVSVKDDSAGKRLKCPACGRFVDLPPARSGQAANPRSRPAAPEVVPRAKGPTPAAVKNSYRPLVVGALLGCLVVAAGVAWFWDEVRQLLTPDEGPADRVEKPKERPPVAGKQSAPAALLKTLRWQFRYDDAGRITRTVDPAGRVTRNRYELDDHQRVRKLVKERDDHSRVVLEFDRFGRRTRMTDPTGTVDYEYDGFNRLTAVRRAGTAAITYKYDARNRVVSLGVGAGFTLGYEYDFLGRLARITTPQGNITYEYFAGAGEIERRLPNGIRTIWKHRPDGKLQSVTHAAADRSILAQFVYAYRPDGLVSKVKEWSPKLRTVSYAYDQVQRLTAVTDSRTGKTTRYRYDKYGNRTELAVPGDRALASSYDWASRLVGHDGHACAHDEAGNLTEYAGARGKLACTYTATDLLATAQVGQTKMRYEYDGDGRLLARWHADEKTAFIPDPRSDVWRPLLATDAQGKQTLYLWDEHSPLAAFQDGAMTLFLHDQQQTVRCAVDQKGRVTGRFEYGPFGLPQFQPVGDGLQPGFAGLFYDPQATLYLTRARGYHPGLGRFLQRDPEVRLPAGSQKDLSSYAYCGNDPVNYVDVNGAGPEAVDQERRQREWAQRAADEANRINQATIDRLNREQMLLQISRQINLHQNIPLPPLHATDDVARRFNWWTRAANQQPDRWLRQAIPDPFAGARASQQPWVLGSKLDLARTQGWFGGGGGAGGGFGAAGGFGGRGTQSGGITGQPGGFSGSSIGGWRSALVPAKVGGVSLRGAGAALKDLGPLKGIALDANGRLILIAQEKGAIKLPPLRLDDVVTVFRSVYEHGDAPSVSIDPDPKTPNGPVMHVRHGPGTANTYVGWVLFEADRVMKTYSLGKDNVTGRAFRSNVEGYQKHLDQRFANLKFNPKEKLWERYWIVPAEVKRLQSKDQQLTLLDVPLKLQTEAMVMRQGKLVPAPSGHSSPRALYFTRWFTGHFGKLVQEARAQPPEDSGLKSEVAIFAELQRICLIAAVAERLRDQGVPLPSWMRAYPVKPFPVPATTPSTLVESDRQIGKKVPGIYGGVTLSPPQEAVRTVAGAAEAEALAPVLMRAVAVAPAFTPVAVEKDGQRYQALALPGNDTQAVGPCRLEETDLAVPVQGEDRISLVRQFHSFAQPADVLGQGWTFDLPRLLKQRRRVRVGGGKVLTRPVYQLTSPLDTYSETFAEQKEVPEVRRMLFVPRSSRAMLGVVETVDDRIHLFFRDGRRWEFNQAGHLTAVHGPTLTVIYQRDPNQRITRIDGEAGKKKAGIVLAYDDQQRLREARGSNGVTIKYIHDEAGRLVRVEGPQGVVARYKYDGSLVTAVDRAGQPSRRFEYDAGGRLRREWQGDEPVAYKVKKGPTGIVISATREGKVKERETAEYDLAYRPLRRTFGDGSRVEWRYRETGATEVTATLRGGREIVLKRSADRRQESWRLPEGGRLAATYDDAGRMTALVQDAGALLRQRWHPSGHLAEVADETAALRPQYSAEGVPSGLLLIPPTKGGKVKRWLEVHYDEQGRPAQITESSGARIALLYDPAGKPGGWLSGQGKVTVRRDPKGRVEVVEASWGYREGNRYDAGTGDLLQAEITRGEARAVMAYDHGRPKKIQQFDGGEFLLTYQDGDGRRGPLQELRAPNGLVLKYQFGAGARLTTVDCGAYKIECVFDKKGRLADLTLAPRKE